MNEKTNVWGKARQWIFWCLIAGLVVGPRLLLQQALPAYLFSDDSHSYLLSAFHWTQTGEWETSPRRGAIYSALIAGVLAGFRDLRMLTWIQHGLGAGTVLTAIFVLRREVPRRCWLLTLVVSAALALSAYPIFYEHSVRSEVLLMLFSTGALGSWLLYLRKPHAFWLLASGIAFGLATLIKNLLLPFPLIVLLFLARDRSLAWRAKTLRLGCFALACLLPFGVNFLFNYASGHPPESAPQSGILLYGRVAQWTVLDSGAQPEIKALIRDDIEAYRKLPRLNNNIILKRSAVPKIYDWLRKRNGSRQELNRICRDLAVEAIRANPVPWLRQVWSDAVRLHVKMTFPIVAPSEEDLQDALSSTSKIKHQDPVLHQADVMKTLGDPSTPRRLASVHRWTDGAWLFLLHPVLLTSLLLPILTCLDRSKSRRAGWLTLCVVWFFNVAIICTVGRPIPRYLAAVLPIIFWTIGGSVILMSGFFSDVLKSGRPGNS